jgi:glycosyltransferase involved in cell wall biosynthesis
MLRCPACRGVLTSPGDESLVCNDCGTEYPIINGIPRLLLPPFREALLANGTVSGIDLKQVHTALSFGFEWHRFPEMYAEWERQFFEYMQPHGAEFFRGKKVLDAGCGNGRFAYYATKFGAEVWAIDLGPAVEVAKRNTDSVGEAQVIQANLHDPPFAFESFDFIYSIGVLHHLPDPEEAFRNLLRFLKPGGDIQVYLYWQPERQPIKSLLLSGVSAARQLTTRLPHQAVYALAYPSAIAAFMLFVWPYRMFRQVPWLRGLAEKLPMKQYASFPFRVCVNDQLDRFSAPIENRYTRAEVKEWFMRAGLGEPRIGSSYGWVATAKKPLSNQVSIDGPSGSKVSNHKGKNMRVLALMPSLYDTSPGQRYRLEQWDPLLRERGVEITYAPFESNELHSTVYKPGHVGEKVRLVSKALRARASLLKTVKDYDVVYIFREAALLGPPIFERLIYQSGVPIVFDFDDAIFVSYKSPSNGYLSYLKFAGKTKTNCRIASHVMVGNPYLAAYASRVNPNVTIIPTTIDTDKYKPLRKNSSPTVVIGWTGSYSTVQHLDTLREALAKLATQVDFRLRVIGTPSYEIPGVQVDAMNWRSETELQDLSEIDIGIMPLPDDNWSKGKCGLKALQFMALGIPTVCSPVGVNTDIIRDNENGLIASSEDEWIRKLTMLLQSAELRDRLGKAGRQTVEEKYSAVSQAPRVFAVLESVMKDSEARVGGALRSVSATDNG